eukprot:9109-Heterococcus_DN1.PRE.2
MKRLLSKLASATRLPNSSANGASLSFGKSLLLNGVAHFSSPSRASQLSANCTFTNTFNAAVLSCKQHNIEQYYRLAFSGSISSLDARSAACGGNSLRRARSPLGSVASNNRTC